MEAEGSQGQNNLVLVAEAEEDFLRPVGRYRIPMVELLLWEAPVILMAVQEEAAATRGAPTEVLAAVEKAAKGEAC